MESLEIIEISKKRIREELDKRFQVKYYRTISTEELAEIELYVQGGKIGLSILDWDGVGACGSCNPDANVKSSIRRVAPW